MLYKNNI